MSFENLGLSADILRAVNEKGYTQATPIQLQAIPVILQGRDIMAGAQTGTGKTAGFTLPLLQRLSETIKPRGKARPPVRALILVPTRELAAQVSDSIEAYGKYVPLKTNVVFGGVSVSAQMHKLQRGVDILVATPGRLLDLANQNAVTLSQVEILVLDEADRMLDMGFIRDIRKILAMLPRQRQNMMFSATFSGDIKQLADGLLTNPAFIEVAQRNTAAERVTQVVHPVDRGRKRELLSHLIGKNNWQQVLVFTRTKHGADRLSEQLEKDGLTSAAIHGNKSQGARTRALSDFKSGGIRVLVATDIAARGIDIDQLPHVVNYELPNVPEDYVHRIGRTGRAGKEGEALSLVCIDEHKLLKDIEKVLKQEIKKVVISGYEVNPSIKAEPILKGRSQGSPQGQNRNQPRQGGQRSDIRSDNRGSSSRSTSSRGDNRSNASHSTDSRSDNRGNTSRSADTRGDNRGNTSRTPDSRSDNRGNASRSADSRSNSQGRNPQGKPQRARSRAA